MSSRSSRLRHAAAKYAAVARIALRQGFSHRGVILGRCGFFVILLLIFSRLWKVVLERGGVAGADAVEMTWYLAITEWVVIGLPLPHQEIERDVRSGEIAYSLPRPISYVGTKLAEAVGALVARLLFLGITGFFAAWALAGALPSDPRGLLLAVPLGLLAGLVGLVFGVAVGVCAFWLQDASPVHWVWQKLTFVFGGLILPLSIYPEWLRAIAEWTPFAAMLYGPGRMALGLDFAAAASTALLLVLWGTVGVVLLSWLYRRGLRILDVNGG